MSMGKTVDLKLVNVIQDKVNLSYVVMANIYPEDPQTMFLTMRGYNTGGGVSVYDVSTASTPRLLTHWDAANHLDNQVEGQDRRGNLLVVAAIHMGKLYVLDVTNPSHVVLVGSTNLDLQTLPVQYFRALHTRIYVEPASGKTYALVTSPITTELVAIEITNPARPQQVAYTTTSVGMIESVTLYGDYAYCGGFMSNKFVAVAIADIQHMHVSTTLVQDYYKQMVSELDPTRPNILYTACWDEPGGLTAFDLADPAHPRELSHVINRDLSKSNRVKIQGNYVYIPLEQKPGGVGIVDISDPRNLAYVKAVTSIEGMEEPYALAVKDDYLYVFGSTTNSMAIMQIIHA